MKKSRGFTLIELLIVTVVIVTLMGIVFRLAGTGSDAKARAETISRLQKLSNALSGYYAAFGSYPPVPLQGRSRDIYTKVNGTKDRATLGYGIQAGPDKQLSTFTLKEGDGDDTIRRQIEAACRAQPVAVGYPLNPNDSFQSAYLEAVNIQGKTSFEILDSDGGFDRNSDEWSKNNVFMFGLLSFLLPRYQFMLNGPENLYRFHRSWLANNRLPYLLDGERPEAWAGTGNKVVQKWLGMGASSTSSPDLKKKAMVENLPSQAVCARWMPNFAEIVQTFPVISDEVFFGVNTEVREGQREHDRKKWFVIGDKGYESKTMNYVQNVKTVFDGWGEEFYYCSFPPYQSYQLWSSGPNKRTFPPWIEKSTLTQDDLKYANKWIKDDIKVGDK